MRWHHGQATAGARAHQGKVIMARSKPWATMRSVSPGMTRSIMSSVTRWSARGPIMGSMKYPGGMTCSMMATRHLQSGPSSGRVSARGYKDRDTPAARRGPERHLLGEKEEGKGSDKVEALAVADARVVAHKRNEHAPQLGNGTAGVLGARR